MTPQLASQIVCEIRTLLARHGAALVGSCEREGIYGEILIMDAKDLPATLDQSIRPFWADQMQVDAIAPETAA